MLLLDDEGVHPGVEEEALDVTLPMTSPEMGWRPFRSWASCPTFELAIEGPLHLALSGALKRSWP